MKILLDIDGVLVITPGWRKPEIENDGFLKFDENAARNLAKIISETNASIILTTTHRISYSTEKWKIILKNRGINPTSISKINEAENIYDLKKRASEIKDWVENQIDLEKYVVIDDDKSINTLPTEIKQNCVITDSLIGLDSDAMVKVFEILYK